MRTTCPRRGRDELMPSTSMHPSHNSDCKTGAALLKGPSGGVELTVNVP
jgi:hypothetical protein